VWGAGRALQENGEASSRVGGGCGTGDVAYGFFVGSVCVCVWVGGGGVLSKEALFN
jgi:hypothetical protein